MTATTASRKLPAAPTRPVSGAQRRADLTRAAIMAETVRCVVDEGFAAASAKHIAERAGVTWGVIQYHFGDRMGLLAAVIESGFEELSDRVAAVDVRPGSLRERVAAIVDAAWAAFSTPTSRASLEISVGTRSQRSPAADRHLLQIGRSLSALGARLVDNAEFGGDPAAVGDLLWATLRGLALAQMVVSEPLDLTRERATLVDVLVAYLEPGGAGG